VKQLRKWLYYWETYGYDRTYYYFLPNYVADKGHVKNRKPNMENVLAGKLEFLKMVKGYDNPTYLKLNERFEKLVSQTKSSFITSILDIWERDGIEKAMEHYYKIITPTSDVSADNFTDNRKIFEDTPRKVKFLETYTIDDFMKIHSCEKIKFYKSETDGDACFTIITPDGGEKSFGPVSRKFDWEKLNKENTRISKVEGKNGDILYIMHNKSERRKNSSNNNVPPVENQ